MNFKHNFLLKYIPKRTKLLYIPHAYSYGKCAESQSTSYCSIQRDHFKKTI